MKMDENSVSSQYFFCLLSVVVCVVFVLAILSNTIGMSIAQSRYVLYLF